VESILTGLRVFISQKPHFKRSGVSIKLLLLKEINTKKFGLVFWTYTIRSNGGNRVLYIDSRKPSLVQALNKMLTSHQHWKDFHPFYETFGLQVIYPTKTSDFRWEREWRLVGNINFLLKRLLLAFAPKEKSLSLKHSLTIKLFSSTPIGTFQS
jgi:hypothetical protein